MMRQNTITVLLIALLLVIPMAIANNDEYLTNSNTNDHQKKVSGNLEESGAFYTFLPPSSNTGPTGYLIEPVVDDYDNNGVNDIILESTGDEISLVLGTDVETEVDSYTAGDLTISPAICDINNDGKKEYIGVYDYNGSSYFRVLTVQNNKIVELYNESVPATVVDANIVCSQFYSGHGDNKWYAHWISADRNLNTASITGGVLSVIQEDIDGGIAKHAAGTVTYTGGQSMIIQVEEFKEGENSLLWTQGDYLIALHSDDDVDDELFNDDLQYSTHGDTVNNGRLLLVGNIQTTKVGTRVLLSPSFSYLYGTVGFLEYKTPMQTYSRGTFGIGEDQNNIMSFGMNTDVQGRHDFGIGMYNSSGKDDIYAFVYVTKGGFGFYSNPTMYIFDSTLLTQKAAKTLLSGPGATAPTGAIVGRSFYITRSNDVVFLQNNTLYQIEQPLFNVSQRKTLLYDSGGMLFMPVMVDYNKDGALDFIYSAASRTAFYTGTPATGNTAASFPFSVDQFIKGNGSVISRVTTNYSNPENDYKYSVICDLSEKVLWNEVFLRGYDYETRNVSMGVIDPENYTQTISFTQSLDVNETFSMIKTATLPRAAVTQKISIQIPNEETLQIYNYDSFGRTTMRFNVERNGTNYLLYRVANGVDAQNIANFTSNDPRLNLNFKYYPKNVDLIPIFDISVDNAGVFITDTNNDFNISSYNGVDISMTELFLQETNNPGTVLLYSIGMFTAVDATPPIIDFQNGAITYEDGFFFQSPPPSYEYNMGQYEVYPGPDYDAALILARQAAVLTEIGGLPDVYSSSLNEYLGQAIFSDDPSVTKNNRFAYWATIGLIVTNLPSSIASFLVRDTVETNIQLQAQSIINSAKSLGNDINIVGPASVKGYTSVAGGNEVFMSACRYTAPGTYTQRHFLMDPGAADDYSNYKDVVVVFTGEDSVLNPGNIEITGADITGKSDALTIGLADLLNTVGLTSTAGKFLFWLALMVVISGFLIYVNVLLGIFSIIGMIILGALFGMIPIWIIIILVIVLGFGVVFTFRSFAKDN